MHDELEIVIESVNEKVMSKGVSGLNPDHPIVFDFAPPIGDGQGFLGLEMLLMSFAGCVSTAVLALLRRTGKNFSNYKMKVIGIRREKPLSMEKITAEVSFDSEDISEGQIQRIIRLAEDISPVWLAIKGNVEVTLDYRITRS